jgi:uncharacterized protein (DUF2147 family)
VTPKGRPEGGSPSAQRERSLVIGVLRAILSVLLAAPLAGHAQAELVEGQWTTRDDATGKPRALVRIEAHGESLTGRIERLLDPDDPADARCEACEGARRGQPVVGMTFLSGLHPAIGEPGVWEGGEILDPDNGRVYRARLRLQPDRNTLEVRGYLGVPMFGRSQVWQRAQP